MANDENRDAQQNMPGPGNGTRSLKKFWISGLIILLVIIISSDLNVNKPELINGFQRSEENIVAPGPKEDLKYSHPDESGNVKEMEMDKEVTHQGQLVSHRVQVPMVRDKVFEAKVIEMEKIFIYINDVSPEKFDEKCRMLTSVLIKDPALVNTIMFLSRSSPLNYAVTRVFKNGKQLELVQLLIMSGADVNSAYGNLMEATPLLNLVHFNHFAPEVMDIVKVLVENGADVDTADVFGRTFLDVAAWKAEPDIFHKIVVFLVSINATQSFTAFNKAKQTMLHTAVEYMEVRKATLTVLKMHGVDFNAVNFAGLSILSVAIVEGGSSSFLKTLIGFGADWRYIDVRGQTGLHHAAYVGNLPAIELLISLGLDVTAADEFGFTPLHSVLDGQDNNNNMLLVVVVLLRNGASVDVKDHRGFTPIDVAKQRTPAVDYQILFLLEKSSKQPIVTDRGF